MKVNYLDKQFGAVLRPMFFNQDGTSNITITLGFMDDAGNFIAQGQQNHYLTQEETKQVLQVKPNQDETLDDVLDRSILDLLRNKSAIQF